MSRLVLSLSLVLAFGLLAAPCLVLAAQDTDKLKKVETEMVWQKKRQQVLEQESKQASGNIQDLHQRLIDATAALQTKEEEQLQVEARLRGIENEITDKNASYDKTRRELAALIDVLVRLAEQPPESYFLRAGLTDEHIHRAILARSLLPRLEAESESAARDLVVLADLKWMAGEQKRLVAASAENLKAQQSGLDQLVRARQGSLNRTEAQKTAISKHLVALTEQAHDLHQLLTKVSPPGYHPKTPALKAVLERPVAGTVVRQFGSKDVDGIVSHGLTYTALPGSRVVAPLAGRVVFAGPFRGYGQILILQHQGGYHSFLAGFGRIDAEMGQEVAAGEPLGILPVKSTGGKPELYFEWRRNGEPVDPMEEKFRNRAASTP